MLLIEKKFADEMIAHAIEDDPDECCGILAGTDQAVSELYRVTNTAHSPYRYLMDPQEQLNAMLDSERKGWDLLAFYHSHTHTPAYPSPTDVRMALESGPRALAQMERGFMRSSQFEYMFWDAAYRPEKWPV